MRVRIAFAAFTLLALAGFHLQPSLADNTPTPQAASHGAPVASYGPTRADRDRQLVQALTAAHDDQLARFYTWAASQPAPRPARNTARSGSAVYGSGACGGDLPPCSVMMCESGGSLTAHNASGADGKWQFMPGTWADHGGYDNPSDAPEEVQDERAREVYAGGAGRRAWVC